MIPTPKYQIGDTVWSAGTSEMQARHECPDCKGSEKWSVTSPAGETIEIQCPRCSSYSIPRDIPSLAYRKATAKVSRLTIGSVRIDTAARDGRFVEYMCNETGVGSGTLHRESDLYQTEAEAQQAADEKARAVQARFDVEPQSLAAAGFAARPLRAAMVTRWDEDLYRAWDEARALRNSIRSLICDDGDELPYPLESSDVTDNLRAWAESVLEPREWRREHPFFELRAAAAAVVGGDPSEMPRLAAAVAACTAPELREPAAT